MDTQKLDALKRELCEVLGYDPMDVLEIRIPARDAIEVTVWVRGPGFRKLVDYIAQE